MSVQILTFFGSTLNLNMDLSDQVTISIPFISVVIAVVAVLAVTIGLTVYIARLNKKVNILTPKFGFGGKSITTIAIVAFLAGAAPLVTLLTSRSTEIRRQAGELKSVVFNAQILDRRDGEVVVGFSVVPMENGVVWVGDKYSAVWEVTGPTSFTFLEQDLNAENPSYITRVLAPGEYEVKLLVTGEDFEVEKIEQLSL